VLTFIISVDQRAACYHCGEVSRPNAFVIICPFHLSCFLLTQFQRLYLSLYKATVRLPLEKGVDVDAEDGGGFLVAAMLGHEAVVRLLLENGADINTDNKDGEKALLMAARLGWCGYCSRRC
jgi:ankyrin repeat protein